MLHILPNELIIKILDNLDHEGLMKIYEIDNYKDLIKNNVWTNITIKLVKKKRIQKFIDSGWIKCFVKYDLFRSEIDDDLLKNFSHCKFLNLNECFQITNLGIKHVLNCPILLLGMTKINSDIIKYLSNCKELNLSQTNINNEDLKYLENVEDLDISYCRNITLSAIQYLKNIKTLNVMMSGVSNDIMNNYNLLDYTPKIRELFPNIKFVNIELPSQMEYYENY
jgi:hypothetical protein